MADFPLDPEMVTFIDRYLEVSGLSTATTVAQQRDDYDKVVACFKQPRPESISSEDTYVDGRHGSIPIRTYHHAEGNERARILFFHGGGFILGSLETHDDICAEICAKTRFDLVSVNYRHAPEFLHPVQLDDVEDALQACWQENTILLGISAGGALAAGLSHRRRNNRQKAAGQVLVYPALGGDNFDLDSYRTNAEAPLLSTEDIRFYRGVRCQDGVPPDNDPEFYPLLADDFAGLPPTIAISADVDPLRDDSELYVEKLHAAGIKAKWINEPGVVHDFVRARHLSKRAGEAFDHIGESICELAG